MKAYTKQEVCTLDGRALEKYGDGLEAALASNERMESIARRFALEATPQHHYAFIVPRWGWVVYVEHHDRYIYY